MSHETTRHNQNLYFELFGFKIVPCPVIATGKLRDSVNKSLDSRILKRKNAHNGREALHFTLQGPGQGDKWRLSVFKIGP